MQSIAISHATIVHSSIAGATMDNCWRNVWVVRGGSGFSISLSDSFSFGNSLCFSLPPSSANRNHYRSSAAKASGVHTWNRHTRPLRLLDGNNSKRSNMVSQQRVAKSSFCFWSRSSHGKGEKTGENKTLHVDEYDTH